MATHSRSCASVSRSSAARGSISLATNDSMSDATVRCSGVRKGSCSRNLSIGNFGVRRQSEAATALWMSHVYNNASLPLRRCIILVKHLNPVCLESIDSLHLCWFGSSLEPRSRTPRILIRNEHQTVLHRVLVYIIQSGEIRLLIS